MTTSYRVNVSRGDLMRRALALILAGVVSAAVGCSSGAKVTTAPASSTSATSAPTEQAPSSEAPSTPPSPATSAAVGDTLDLTGDENGQALAVTVVKVVDPAAAANDFSTPGADKRFIAVQFRLENTGAAVYTDSPSNGAKIVDTLGQQFEATVEDTAAGPSFPGSVTISPGDTGLGFITFEIPTSSKIAKVQFAMNSGFAGDTGQWNVSGE
ncbi:DUF4352 domain-containing protein [Streptomyces sp. NPDC050549]|uniref:DUF4352 domain-containing protein n=1 Tax=Streptomyces sp. NPDC050549 TaxID=3155406 RepID=UPI0034360336